MKLWAAIVAVWRTWTGRERRNDEAFDSSQKINAGLVRRVEWLEGEWVSLIRKDEQQQAQLDDCREKHEECDEDRKELASRVARLESQVEGK